VSALSESRGRAASAEAPGLQRRMVAAGPIVAVVSMVAALIATGAAGIPLRDPDHVAGRRLVLLLGLVALLVALDVVVRASRRAPGLVPSRALVAEVRRERWTWRRGAVVATALVTPHAAYASPEAEAELQRRVGAALRAALDGGAPDGAIVAPRR